MLTKFCFYYTKINSQIQIALVSNNKILLSLLLFSFGQHHKARKFISVCHWILKGEEIIGKIDLFESSLGV